MNKFNDDKILGSLVEDYIIDCIEEHFDTKIIKTDQYDLMDYYDDKAYYEIKARRNNYKTYPTTMIGYNKILFAQQSNKDVYFIFSFNDGDYYYKYNINDKFIINIGGRNDRGKQEYKKYYFIPIEKLNKF
jgi:hypothetical protein